ncbi:hypothetical protein PWT90_05036 [Aphanocladium album]|nr:hypothetical protein PWT90_05036 [Aphanocladium album]
MSAAIFARASASAARRAATFSTSARAMRPAAESGINMGSASAASASSGSAWAWRNLSPKTRQYVKIGAATCAATDAFVLYNYPEMVGLKKVSE